MKKIGIFGGTFDPPHIGHLIVAEQVFHQCELDEIWFMPNYIPPHKEKNSNSTAADRLKMLELAIRNQPYFKIEPIELDRKGLSYSYDTIVLLKERNKDTQFFFIIGADMVDYLPNWHRIDELVQIIDFIAVDRPTYEGKSPYPVHFIDIPTIHLSSSMLREKVSKGESVQYLMPDSVIQFIKEHGLYGTK